ncbi:hypothetical protein [Actinomadura rugatobispora]|uniref:SseB family protein n=1 Tax=Actinomadura rugatobispora TaxID=1994 RepID=A0ABW0ZX37_9ACTN|nr:hypothetical protein GCM10010200_017050 [Actinomadura rugatobispora]
MTTTPPTAARRLPAQAGVLIGGFGSLFLIFLCALPWMWWRLDMALAVGEEDAPAPLHPGLILGWAILVGGLTAGAGAVLCLPRFFRRAPGLGPLMIFSWVFVSLVSQGTFTGLHPSLYDTMREPDSWRNSDTGTDPDVLAGRVDRLLVDALSAAPGTVVSARPAFAGQGRKTGESFGLRAGGVIVPAKGQEPAGWEALESWLAHRLTRLSDKAAAGGAAFKLDEDIVVELQMSDTRDLFSLTISTPKLDRRFTGNRQRTPGDAATAAQVVAMARTLDPKAAPAMPQGATTIPCSGSAGRATIYSAQDDLSEPVSSTLLVKGSAALTGGSGRRGTLTHITDFGARIAVGTIDGLHVGVHAGDIVSVFQRCR